MIYLLVALLVLQAATLLAVLRAQHRDRPVRPGAQDAPPSAPPAPAPATEADLETALAPLRAELAALSQTIGAASQDDRPASEAEGRGMPPAQIAEAARRAALTTGQQMEWRAHLCHILDWPFGALPATRHWAASPDLLVHLATQLLDRKPGVVVECGSGLSTLVSARALHLAGGGVLHSLEANESFAEVTRARLARLGLGSIVTIHHAPIEPLAGPTPRGWYALSALDALPERIDFLFVDGPQVVDGASRAPAIAQLFPRIATGGA
ncbi:MAG: class I SAM-dependent methyltransferase, partial [Pseudomonadota bacterium]